MSHSKMLNTRRAKQKNRKQLANMAKREKKLRQQDVNADGGGAAKQKSA